MIFLFASIKQEEMMNFKQQLKVSKTKKTLDLQIVVYLLKEHFFNAQRIWFKNNIATLYSDIGL